MAEKAFYGRIAAKRERMVTEKSREATFEILRKSIRADGLKMTRSFSVEI